jgi:phosphotransferase system enzyme I (PtsI)
MSTRKTDSLDQMDTLSEMRYVGIAASPGIALGPAHCIYDIPPPCTNEQIVSDPATTLVELAAFESAVQRASHGLEDISRKVASQVGANEATIFKSHLSILHDQTLLEKVRRLISGQGLTSLVALRLVADEYERVFSSVTDQYLRERVADVRDVLRRLESQLTNVETHFLEPLHTPVILVARELLPSEIVAITEHNILGIVTQSGGRTSHAAILARSYGIPSVAGVAAILDTVRTGDSLIVDGGAGCVFVNPAAETLRQYKGIQSKFERLRDRLALEPIRPVQTADGIGLQLWANVGCVADAQEAEHAGASGIGLYRTEFYFLKHPGIPSEDEQVAEYRAVIDASPEGPITIRTLDLGGDKATSYFSHSDEANPLMGWRSIRLSLEHPDLFLQQIRAVLRAAGTTTRTVRLLFPMITELEELRLARKFIIDARDELDRQGCTYSDVAVGAMIEVPAAAVMIEHLLEEVDFVSIGTNDLAQYMAAADRDNSKVGYLCQSLSPAVIRVIRSVIEAGRRAEKEVAVCGEMAGSPRAFPLLVGMGLQNFSMSPAFIRPIRDLASHVTMAQCAEILSETLTLRTTSEVQKLLDEYIISVCPDATPWLLQ